MATLPEIVLPVRVAERPGTGRQTFGKGGNQSAERTWVVPWSDPATGKTYLDYVAQLLGQTLSGPNLQPVITYPDIFSPELPWLYCQEVEVEGEDLAGTDAWGRATYRRALLKAKYMPLEMGESFRLAAQLLSFKENTYSFLGAMTNPPAKPPYWLDDLDAEIEQLEADIARAEAYLAGHGAGHWQPLYPGAPLAPDQLPDQVWVPEDPEPIDPSVLGGLPGQDRLDLDETAAALAADRERLEDLQTQRGLQEEGGGLTKAEYQAQVQAWAQALQARVSAPGVSDAYYQQSVGDDNPVPVPVGKIVPMGEYTLERKFVRSPNFFNYIALLGCTNAQDFQGFPPWTLLFHGLDGKRTVMPSGARVWDLHFKFMFNPNGHNLLYRGERGRWEVIVSRGVSSETWLTGRDAALDINNPDTAGVALNDDGTWGSAVHKYLYQPADFSSFLYYA